MLTLRKLTLVLIIAGLSPLALADEGDTTVVITYAQELQNIGTREVTDSFAFPNPGIAFNEVYMVYRLDCPGAPGDCDPWDRTARLSVVRQLTDTTSERIEIARVITPYDITGGGGPGHCEWAFDMTDYLPILTGSVSLLSFVDTWIGGSQGWLVTCTFYFIEGSLTMRPYRVVNLWDIGYVEYGNPDNPPEEHMDQVIVDVEPFAEYASLRIWTTGHGQGNTHNAAEFSQKMHGVWIGLDYFEHLLWRNDCAQNDCSPQGGTWQFNRAGWCPGDRVYPWDLQDVAVTPGQPIDIWPTLQAYENLCRPNNPDCVSGVTCPDCNYNSTGHTQPGYITSGQLILWTSQDVSTREQQSLPTEFVLHQNFPNPFNPGTQIAFSLARPGHAQLRVFDVQGREVASLLDRDLSEGMHRVRFDGAGLASGVYFARLDFADQSKTVKMLMMK